MYHRAGILLIVLGLALAGCASQRPSVLRDLDRNPPGTLRLMQVRAIADKDALAADDAYARLIRSSFQFISPFWKADEERQGIFAELHGAGLSDADLAQGAVAIGNVYCCGGPYEFIYRVFAYLPATVEVHEYDTVEVRLGREPGKAGAAEANRVTRRVHRYKQPPYNCAWQPDNPQYWTRILYCDGLKEDGWALYRPLWREYGHTWRKLPPGPGAHQPEP
ncbi:hypothetical protein EZJ19_11405 [Parasulfuritortus cantonensis]|uniref:Lipoprotein n=1 Tax=Parasulfuritortus cantonensis TaxID=2528202 RepID=A0A4R1B7Y8_9PROT|nr:hypothetical protein [Parasulfuritortus cantonensis]TCJ12838.1 hypothetical protein EZJ19_11405 [Parasulfuritortus cantonensis]